MSDRARQTQAKSRLGSLLIKKGLLTSQQLDQALQQQLKTGMRLGEVLIAQGLLTERQLNRALKRQSRYRFIAAFMAMLMGPLSMGAFASQNQTDSSQQANAEQTLEKYRGLQSLDDDELDSVQGQALLGTPQEAFANLYQAAEGDLEEDELGALDDMVSILNPLSSLLDADVSITGVKYHDHKPKQIVHEDGSIELAMPAEIKEIAMRDLRVKGAPATSSFGDIVISNIRFSENSSMRIRIRE